MLIINYLIAMFRDLFCKPKETYLFIDMHGPAFSSGLGTKPWIDLALLSHDLPDLNIVLIGSYLQDYYLLENNIRLDEKGPYIISKGLRVDVPHDFYALYCNYAKHGIKVKGVIERYFNGQAMAACIGHFIEKNAIDKSIAIMSPEFKANSFYFTDITDTCIFITWFAGVHIDLIYDIINKGVLSK